MKPLEHLINFFDILTRESAFIGKIDYFDNLMMILFNTWFKIYRSLISNFYVNNNRKHHYSVYAISTITVSTA